MTRNGFSFFLWIDRARPLAGALLVIAPAYAVGMLYFFGSPMTTDVGYQPVQPIPFSHKLHAGELGLDCRYCHTTVEEAAKAAVPPTSICMNCHKRIAVDSEKTLRLREAAASGEPIPWVRVHDLPDFCYFDHSAHVSRGVSCVSCHGRVDTMEEVRQVKPLSMGWCLACHRAPEEHLRPPRFVTDLDWVPEEDRLVMGARLRKQNDLNPSTDCSTCHR